MNLQCSSGCSPLWLQQLQASYLRTPEPESKHIGARIPRSGPEFSMNRQAETLGPTMGDSAWQGDLLGPSLNYIPGTVAGGQEYSDWPLDGMMGSGPLKPHG